METRDPAAIVYLATPISLTALGTHHSKVPLPVSCGKLSSALLGHVCGSVEFRSTIAQSGPFRSFETVLESPLEFTNRSVHWNLQIVVEHLCTHLHVEDDDDEEEYGDEDDEDTEGQEGKVRADGRRRLENSSEEDAGEEEEEATTTTTGTMR